MLHTALALIHMLSVYPMFFFYYPSHCMYGGSLSGSPTKVTLNAYKHTVAALSLSLSSTPSTHESCMHKSMRLCMRVCQVSSHTDIVFSSNKIIREITQYLHVQLSNGGIACFPQTCVCVSKIKKKIIAIELSLKKFSSLNAKHK